VRPAFLDHVTLDVSDLTASRRFYAAALAALDAVEHAGDGAFAYGPPGGAHLWIRAGRSSAPVHIAIAAPSPEHVDAFHRAALAAGGRDNGAPGLRPRYDAAYYAAFVLDPDGNNIEAVHRGPGSE
jgi:catechol 2,3-dioxygenase-like lactoylglutathione lyase family enzyme